jgi:hypothetical protein
VRYDAVNADLKSTVAQQRRDLQATIAQLTARFDDQASQIRKVSAQLAAASPSRGGLEANKFAAGRIHGGRPAPHVVNNP